MKNFVCCSCDNKGVADPDENFRCPGCGERVFFKEDNKEWVQDPVLTEQDLWVVESSPMAVVYGLQSQGLSLAEQLTVLEKILKKYERQISEIPRQILQKQIAGLSKEAVD